MSKKRLGSSSNLLNSTTRRSYQPQRNPGEKEVAQIGTHALQQGDEHNHQRHGLQQLQIAQIRVAREQAGFRIGQPVDEVLEDVGEHRLGRCENQKPDDAEEKKTGIGPHVSQKAEVDRQR